MPRILELVENAAGRIWNNKISAYVLLTATGIAALILMFSRDPVPGVAVAVLGLAAALTAIRELEAPEKIAWVFIFSVLLYAELRAIRIENESHKQEIENLHQEFEIILQREEHAFEVTRDGFKETKGGFDKTLKATNETLNQTRPHADIQYAQENIFLLDAKGNAVRAPNDLYVANRRYEIALQFVNRGATDATDVKVLAGVYLAPYEDQNTPQKAVGSFLRFWSSRKPTDWSENHAVDVGHKFRFLVPNEMELQTFYKSFSQEDISALKDKNWRIYFLTRIEYSEQDWALA